MKKAFIFIPIFIIFIPYTASIAQTTKEERRIEEDKRESLKPTEAHGVTQAKTPPSAPLDSLDLIYLVELSPKKVTYGYDACKVLTILLGVENEYIDLNSQVAFLKEKKLLPKHLEQNFDPMQPLRKGLAAYIFCKALEIKGGVMLRIMGINERYALKELVQEGIMYSGNTHDIVSGEELTFMLNGAANYLATKQTAKISKTK